MVRALKALALVLACWIIGCAMHPLETTSYPLAPSVQVWISGKAKQQVDSLAWLTGVLRQEQAVCVSAYRVVTTEHGTIIKLDKLDSAGTHFSDSLNIYVPKPSDRLCPSSTPVLHTHVVENDMWGQPSPLDQAMADRFYTAPFQVVLSVRDRKAAKLTVYALR